MRKPLPIRCATTLPSACTDKETRLSCTELAHGCFRAQTEEETIQLSRGCTSTLHCPLGEEQLMLWHLNSSSLNSPSVLDGTRANTNWRLPISRVLRENSILHINTCPLSYSREETSRAEYGGIHKRAQ